MSDKKNKRRKKKSSKKKFEFSKMLSIFAVVVLTGVAIYSIVEYYILIEKAIEAESSVLIDATLPITSITSILAVVLSYCLYQGMLKHSLNKNQLSIGEDGVIRPLLENLNHLEHTLENGEEILEEDLDNLNNDFNQNDNLDM